MPGRDSGMEKERYDWLDALRGAAIILVIIGHVIDGLHYGQNMERVGFFNKFEVLFYPTRKR